MELQNKHTERTDQFPDEDEEYDLLCQQELEASATSFPSSSQLTTEFGALSGIAASVNRRLFSTPCPAERIASTPVLEANAESNNGIQLAETEKAAEEYSIGIRKSGRLKRPLDRFDDDFLFDDVSYVDPIAKKMRAEEKRDFDAIEKILQIRNRKNVSGETSKKGSIQYLEKIRDFKMRNLSYTVPQWPFLPLQRSDQNRIYVRFHSADFESRALNELNARPDIVVFSPEDKVRLWNEANDIILKRTEMRTSEANDMGDAVARVELLEERLWVEKYKPKKYLDLLSAELTNRSLLFWLKMWDKVVFGKDFKPISEASENAHKLNTFNKRTGKFESNGGWLQRKQKQSLNTNTDDYGRPIQKVALLYGAPGLGKTTLAHILARHAGYQPIEINASDDRSPTAFQQALENGTQMTSMLNDHGRPNCIILDEIDGAPKQSIEFLIKFVSDSVQTKRPKGSGKVKKNILRRPIICICNDVYEPALRPLRQIAFLVQFPPIEVMRLEERLKQIAQHERIKTDINALYALAEKTGNDVRCCISTMQFFKAENKSITLHEILKSNVGRKDQHEGLFSVWSKIFQIQRTTEKQDDQLTSEATSRPTNAASLNGDSSRTQSILSCVQRTGDYQRLMQGVYENFLSQKMPDANLYGIVEALDWFVFFDCVQNQINHQQNYTIYPYLPIGFAKWNLLFASLAWPNIKFPSRGYEIVQKTAAHRNIFESFRKGLHTSPGVISLGTGSKLLIEAVPILKRILAPELRHLPKELFSENERENLRHIIDVMIDLGLTYVQLKTLEGSYQFQMEPDLASLIQFHDSAEVQLSYFTKQMLSREVELEGIRRSAPKVSDKINESRQKLDKQSESKSKTVPNQPQKVKSKAVDTTAKLNCNLISKYFSNFVRVKAKNTTATENVTEAPKSDPIVKSPIWYHYKEGFNNAVRKDVHIKELL